METEAYYDELYAELKNLQYGDAHLWNKKAYALLDVAKDTGNTMAQTVAHIHIAKSSFFQSDIDTSLLHAKYALRLSRKHGFDKEEGIAAGIMGVLCSKRNNDSVAADYFHRAISCLKKVNAYEELNVIYSNFTSIYDNIHYYEKSLQCEETAKFYLEKVSDGADTTYKNDITKIIDCVNYAMDYERLGQYDRASQYLLQLIPYQDTFGMHQFRQHINVINAKLAYDYGLSDKFTEIVRLIISTSKEISYNADILNEYLILFDLLRKCGSLELCASMLDVISDTAHTAMSISIMCEVYSRQYWYYNEINDVSALEELRPVYFSTLQHQHSEWDIIKQSNLRSHIQLEHEIQTREEFQRDLKELEFKSTYDALTGLANRLYLNLYSENLFSSCHMDQELYGILILDVDDFKQYNDNHGHIAGDSCLTYVAALLREKSRGQFCARFGGDEFFLISHGLDEAELMQIADDILTGAENEISVSIGGYVSIPKDGQTVNDFIQFADHALYHAKEEGRSKISFWDDRKRFSNIS